jgi:hypothetical protein
MKVLDQVLAEMPNEFTSHWFNDMARKMGVTQRFIKSEGTQKYLYKTCEHISRYGWEKKVNNKPSLKFINPINSDIDQAIALLKSTNDYKIMKRVSDWNEI